MVGRFVIPGKVGREVIGGRLGIDVGIEVGLLLVGRNVG